MFKALLVSLMVFSFVGVSSAKAANNEIGLGTSPLLGYGGRTTGGEFYTDLSNVFIVGVAADYQYAFTKNLGFGITTAFSLADTGVGTVTYLQVLGGPVINIPFGNDTLQNSLFIHPMGGMVLVDVGSSSLWGAVAGDVGYRLGLASNFNWRPTIGIFKVLNGSKVLFAIRPISFSLIF